ncbi:hypothetical protein PR048_026610 [Dryococelus australis]|uniref:Uncharacterized protein n=1 Tax=Dryococelus australis TaxID=614101 RepID=A0ABQ9GLV7_9NEOP|nr:hypothetical protein PR048_026610 [Dryococelus australis]
MVVPLAWSSCARMYKTIPGEGPQGARKETSTLFFFVGIDHTCKPPLVAVDASHKPYNGFKIQIFSVPQQDLGLEGPSRLSQQDYLRCNRPPSRQFESLDDFTTLSDRYAKTAKRQTSRVSNGVESDQQSEICGLDPYTTAARDRAAYRKRGDFEAADLASQCPELIYNSDVVCWIVISVRPNSPTTIHQSRQCYPMSLERQFDVAISPSTYSDDATKVYNQATLSTPEVKEFRNECSASAASTEIPDIQVVERRKVYGIEYLPGVSSSVSDHPQKAAGGANVSKSAAPVCHKRSKPVVNLSSLTKRQPLEVNSSSSIVCRPSSAAPNSSSTSQRGICGIYSDVIRDTSVTEALGRQDGSRRIWDRWPRSAVCRLDEPSPSKFQTFSQFRAEQLSSQMRARWLNRAKSFTDKWQSYNEHLQFYFISNKIEDNVAKLAFFKSSRGGVVQYSLLLPYQTDAVPLREVLTKLHFEPRPN